MLFKGGTASCGEFVLSLLCCLFHGGRKEQMTEDTATVKDRQCLEMERGGQWSYQTGVRSQYLKLNLAEI